MYKENTVLLVLYIRKPHLQITSMEWYFLEQSVSHVHVNVRKDNLFLEHLIIFTFNQQEITTKVPWLY